MRSKILKSAGFISDDLREIKRASAGPLARREVGGTEVSKVDDALAMVDDFVAEKL